EVLGKDIALGEFRYYIIAKDIYNNTSSYGSQNNPVVVTVTSSDVEGPQVIFTPVTQFEYYAPLEFILQAQDSSGIKSILLYYKNENETTYKQKSFTHVQDNYYRAEILQSEINTSVSTPTLKYFIIATDNRNNSTVIPQNAPQETYKVIIILPKDNQDNKPKISDENFIVFKSQNAVVKFNTDPTNTASYPLNFIIYNFQGKIVRQINSWDKVKINNNICELLWDGKNDNGEKQPPGIYLFRLELNNKLIKSGKILVLR
ncbi:MAG: hypothetical protein NZ839_01725, partial [Endomicrobia bacterium]|nr:hypothetical protein [Endomicrobiia bacterium]